MNHHSFKIITLQDVLADPDEFDPGHFLYVSTDKPWQLKTPCAVLGQSERHGVPTFAQQNGLRYVLELAAVQDIVDNTRQQVEAPSASQLLRAFVHYYENDAFIVFD